MKSSSGLSVFWLASWTRRCPWLLVLLRRGPLPAVFPHRLGKRQGETHKSIHAYTHCLSLRRICVCEHLFQIRHLAPSGGAGFTDRPLWTVTCLESGRYLSQQPDQKQKTKQKNEHPSNITAQWAFCLLSSHASTHSMKAYEYVSTDWIFHTAAFLFWAGI